jgi:citrate synthase
MDGVNGRLVVRGRELRDLVAQGARFEDVAALLWSGRAAAGDIEAGMASGRVRAWRKVPDLLHGVQGLTVVEALRVGLGMLSDEDPVAPHHLVTGALPVMTAALIRAGQGSAPVAPDHTLSTAADFLRMLRGRPAADKEVAALDAYLVTVADHGINASTFTARVIASTKAGMVSAVFGALCALKGPLHGGAPGPVLDMLDAIGTEANIRPWLRAALAEGERLMGFGHRIYRVRDPRADVLKQVAASLADERNRIGFAEQVERAALDLLAEKQPGRRLETNVEFYTALTLEALNLPREAFTAVLAMGRSAGWSAHVMEQEREGRLIRPESRYVGPPADERTAA